MVFIKCYNFFWWRIYVMLYLLHIAKFIWFYLNRISILCWFRSILKQWVMSYSRRYTFLINLCLFMISLYLLIHLNIMHTGNCLYRRHWLTFKRLCFSFLFGLLNKISCHMSICSIILIKRNLFLRTYNLKVWLI